MTPGFVSGWAITGTGVDAEAGGRFLPRSKHSVAFFFSIKPLQCWFAKPRLGFVCPWSVPRVSGTVPAPRGRLRVLAASSSRTSNSQLR